MSTLTDYDLLDDLRSRYHKRPPPPPHGSPSFFNLSQEDANKMRLRYLRPQQRSLRETRDNIHRLFVSPSLPQDQRWFVEWAYLYYNNLLSKIDHQIRLLRPRARSHEQFNLEQIKSVPIDSIVEVNSRNTFSIREERTPSCHYYREQNRWHDFGSSEGGDVIDLVMRINNWTFHEACQYLNNTSI